MKFLLKSQMKECVNCRTWIKQVITKLKLVGMLQYTTGQRCDLVYDFFELDPKVLLFLKFFCFTFSSQLRALKVNEKA